MLKKAIHFKNLTVASHQVGLSQPQLSRLVGKLETDLGVVLLDRTSRRASNWTPAAHRVADIYDRSSRLLKLQLFEVADANSITHLRIGALEGLIDIGHRICSELIRTSSVRVFEYDLYDLAELEDEFSKENLDLILTCRPPNENKSIRKMQIGWQELKNANEGSPALITLSPYEYTQRVHGGKKYSINTEKSLTKEAQVVISNSLAVRKKFIDSEEAQGQTPGPLTQEKPQTAASPVLIIARETLSIKIWNLLSEATRASVQTQAPSPVQKEILENEINQLSHATYVAGGIL